MTIKSLSDGNITTKFSVLRTLQLWLPLSLTIYTFYNYSSPSFSIIIINLLLMYLTVCLGHCVGLHRQIIHESFISPKFMKPVFLLLSSLSGIGGPLNWIKVHALRDHWQNQKKAPKALTYDNSLIYDFFINLHCKIIPKEQVHLDRLPKKLTQNTWAILFEYIWMPLNITLFFVIARLYSYDTALWLFAVRFSLSIVGHWLVGYIVHKWGYESYQIEGVSEQGRNSLVLGWLTFGEGFHNNHHKYPESASMGLKKIECDFAYWTILLLKILKLASKIKLSDEHFSKAKI